MTRFNAIIVALLLAGVASLQAHGQAGASRRSASDTVPVGMQLELGDVVVYGSHRDFGLRSSQMSAVSVTPAMIERTPVFFGEPDVLKSLQRTPGVQPATEGTAGIYVRGGDYDQNYITLDGSPIYNVEHMKGFVSAFNPDMVQGISLYRGGFPARYGSRLSSVVDVGIEPGDFASYHGKLSLGVLSSRLQVAGPIWKSHTSFNLGARVSYFDLIAKPILDKVYDNSDGLKGYENMGYWDVTAKLVHRFNPSHRLSAMVYYGYDRDHDEPSNSDRVTDLRDNPYVHDYEKIRFEDHRAYSTKSSWHNLLASLYWTAWFSPRVRLNTNLSYSAYKYDLKFDYTVASHNEDKEKMLYDYNENVVQQFKTLISEVALTSDVLWSPLSNHMLRAGVSLSRQRLKPEAGVSRVYDKVKLVEVDESGGLRYASDADTLYFHVSEKQYLNTWSAYVEDDFTPFGALRLNAGFRAIVYSVRGHTSFSPEPRLLARLMMGSNLALKASYARMSQGIHRLVSGNLVMASDRWVAMTSDIPMMKSDQCALGLDASLPWHLSLSVEGYYKWLKNLIDYRDGVSYNMTQVDWRDLVAVGKGHSYGLELMLERKAGNLTGWLSYTWSKSLRQFNGHGNVVNGGREFYAPTDHRHNFNITVTQHFSLSHHWNLDLTAAWSYLTGRRGTIANTMVTPPALYEYYAGEADGTTSGQYISFPQWVNRTFFILHMGDTPEQFYTTHNRNTYVLPAIHHLDLTASFSHSWKYGESAVALSIYNVYDRLNVSNVYVGFKDTHAVLKGMCPFPFMPSLSFTHKF